MKKKEEKPVVLSSTQPNCQCWMQDRRQENRRVDDLKLIRERSVHFSGRGDYMSIENAKKHNTNYGWVLRSSFMGGIKLEWNKTDKFCKHCGTAAIPVSEVS